MRLSEVTTAATPSADGIEVVILPPDDGQLSEEEQIHRKNDTLPADAAGQIEVREYNK